MRKEVTGMTKKCKKKKLDSHSRAEIAKWMAIGAWAVLASGVVELLKMIVKHFLK